MTLKNDNTFEENKIAAIIGYWRCGMSLVEISLTTDMPTVNIEDILKKYFKNKK